MRGLAIPNRGATFALISFFLVINGALGLYSARGIEPSADFGILAFLGAVGVMTYWIHADCLRLRIQEPLDLGWFVILFWPLSFPYHLVKTRGSKGLITFVGLAVVFILTYLVGILVYLLARGAGSQECWVGLTRGCSGRALLCRCRSFVTRHRRSMASGARR